MELLKVSLTKHQDGDKYHNATMEGKERITLRRKGQQLATNVEEGVHLATNVEEGVHDE